MPNKGAIYSRKASHSLGLCKALMTSMDEAANITFLLCRLLILSIAHSQLLIFASKHEDILVKDRLLCKITVP